MFVCASTSFKKIVGSNKPAFCLREYFPKQLRHLPLFGLIHYAKHLLLLSLIDQWSHICLGIPAITHLNIFDCIDATARELVINLFMDKEALRCKT